jgi:hypothetical protein
MNVAVRSQTKPQQVYLAERLRRRDASKPMNNAQRERVATQKAFVSGF